MSLPLPMYGALLATMLATGLLLIARGVPLARRIDLNARIAPYLDRPALRSRLLEDPSQPLQPGAVLGPLAGRLAELLDRTLGGTESVRQRLQQAGTEDDVEGFRIQQVLWGCAAGVLMAAVASLLWWTRGASLGAMAVVVACAAAGGVILRDQLLSRAARARQQRIVAEFPALAELLALSVTAGEGTAQALERVARLSSGDLSAELERSLARARGGVSLADALQGLSERAASPPITRFVDGLIVAIQRGTPLGEVLRAQAQDARESARQALIEEGGKREIAMMVPVVFLVLPVTVLFAIYPGISMLRLSV